MKRFIFLLMMTICIGVANANLSYQTSHEVTEQTQIIQPPGCDFEFNCTELVISASVVMEHQEFFVVNYLDPFRLCGMIYNNYTNRNYIHYSGSLSPPTAIYKYLQCTAGINYRKHNYIHYSG
jgi:hypothetical protein